MRCCPERIERSHVHVRFESGLATICYSIVHGWRIAHKAVDHGVLKQEEVAGFIWTVSRKPLPETSPFDDRVEFYDGKTDQVFSAR